MGAGQKLAILGITHESDDGESWGNFSVCVGGRWAGITRRDEDELPPPDAFSRQFRTSENARESGGGVFSGE